ncbi:hypothetical protein BD779DRAFT_1476666 [Infundibulicybe gibba]|nr:hypothetical protein BD779DRAFT_1476666 [Infundibulicybe gibba]
MEGSRISESLLMLAQLVAYQRAAEKLAHLLERPGWLGYIKIDGVTWEWLGSTENATALVNIGITPTRTMFTFTAGPMEVEVTFLSPTEPKDLVRQLFPFTYVYLTANATAWSESLSSEWVSVDGQWNASDVMMRVNPTEVVFAAFPAYLYLNASWAGFLLRSSLQQQASVLPASTYAMPDLGSSYPSALGNTPTASIEALAIESSGDMIIMALAHVIVSGDGSLVSRYGSLGFARWVKSVRSSDRLISRVAGFGFRFHVTRKSLHFGGLDAN